MLAVKLLLTAECAWFAASYVRGHIYEERRPVLEIPGEAFNVEGSENKAGGSTYGIGFETDSQMFFWFRSRREATDGD